MKQQIHNLVSFLTHKKIYYALLFVYFGFMAIPQWFRPFSRQFLVWLLALPIIVIALIVIGVWGIVGIWRTNKSKEQSNPKHVFFAQISGAGLLWFVVSFALAYGTHFLYNHQKFDSEIWRNPNSARYVSYDLTPRQRMLDDVVENVLPGSTQDEIETLLGESTNTGYFSRSERDLIYVLGAERGLGVDSEWLLIWFDDSGNFERYEITTD
ncbi:MAG: hypothetical protein HZB77_07640 [Chloroflexi bacterium]|nr:hypothetical protein [Chloroflexota bacterium]